MDISPSILSQLDFGNTDDHSARTKIVNIVVITTTFVIVGIRTLIRRGIVGRLSWEDIIIILAALFQIGYSTEILYALQFGLGKHVWLTASNLAEIVPNVRQLVEVMFFANITYNTSIALIKLSIITCFIRVFPNKAMRWFCAITGFLIVSVWICSFFTTIFTCKKISDQWEFDNVNRQCIEVIPYYYFATATNTFTDIALTIAPVPLLLRIAVSRRDKVILCGLFGMGLFAGACSVVRLLSLRNLYTPDISFGSSDTLDWSTIELGVGIFCASVPSLKPLLGRWNKKNTVRPRAQPYPVTVQPWNGTKEFELATPTTPSTPSFPPGHTDSYTIALLGTPSSRRIDEEKYRLDQIVMTRSLESLPSDVEKEIGMAM